MRAGRNSIISLVVSEVDRRSSSYLHEHARPELGCWTECPWRDNANDATARSDGNRVEMLDRLEIGSKKSALNIFWIDRGGWRRMTGQVSETQGLRCGVGAVS